MKTFSYRRSSRHFGNCQHVELKRTPGDQSEFRSSHTSGAYRFILVSFYLFIGHVSNGNCQTWPLCRDSDKQIVDNCLTSATDGKWRCFCLHYEWYTSSWDQANSQCRSTYRDHEGGLAIDDSMRTNDILGRLVAENLMADAWIGARTLPWYWNWMATKENREPQHISYQGCYTVVNTSPKQIFRRRTNLRENCRSHCETLFLDLFALEKRPSELLWFCSCVYTWNPSSFRPICLQCDLASHDHGWCGIENLSKAVYTTKAAGGPCNEEDRGPQSNLCFWWQSRAKSQRQAAEYCQSQGMSLVSVMSYKIHEDIRQLLKGIVTYDYFWTSGTSLRWVWTTGKEVGPVSQYLGWPGKEDFAFENMCMTFSSSGYWVSKSCTERKPYICEAVVAETEIIPRQTTAFSSQNTEINKATTLSEAKSTELKVTDTTPGRALVSSEPSSVRAPETTSISTFTTEEQNASSQTPDGKVAGNGHQVALTAGATVGGILCLLILIAIIVFLCRRKQRMQKATSHTCVHNDLPLNNLRSNGTVSPTATPSGAYENIALRKEADYYNVAAACMKDKKQSGSNMSRYDESFSKGINLQRKNGSELRTYESACTADPSDNIKTEKLEMMENDMYCSSSLPGFDTDTADNKQGTATSHEENVSLIDSSRVKTKEMKTCEESDHQYYNFTKLTKKTGNVTDGVTYMVDNDIYVPSNESGHILESLPNMTDNDIYETADDDINKLGKGKVQQSKPQIPYPKPQEMQHSHLQAATGHYELASPVTQTGHQGQEAEKVQNGIGNDLYANVNKAKPKQHTTREE